MNRRWGAGGVHGIRAVPRRGGHRVDSSRGSTERREKTVLRQALDWTSMHISRGADVSEVPEEVSEGGKSMWASATA